MNLLVYKVKKIFFVYKGLLKSTLCARYVLSGSLVKTTIE